jgi:16S rRNA G966 N2-methylase RsmD
MDPINTQNEQERVQNIKINPEYEKLVPELSAHDFQSLKKSIREDDAAHIPIFVNPKREILDGHHRWKIICELAIKDYKIIAKNFGGDVLAEKKFVIDCNLNRRHLIDYQKVELGFKLKPILLEIAKRNQSIAGKKYGRGKNTNNNNSSGSNEPHLFEKIGTGRVNEEIAKKVGLSRTTYERGEIILKRGTDQQKEKLKEGKMEINTVYNIIRKEEAKIKLLAENGPKNLPESLDLKLGDFRNECKEIPDNSIHVIFTDPPYAKKFLSLYDGLAEVAARVLKDSGSIVTYCGQDLKLQVIEFMKSKGLVYWWDIAVIHSGPFSSFFPKNILVKWKPLLWFVKCERPYQNGKIFDLIHSTKPEKILHDWEQSYEDASYVIEHLSKSGERILDPFMGSGTTGVAALNLKRQFIGIEKDPEVFEIAKASFAFASTKSRGLDA